MEDGPLLLLLNDGTANIINQTTPHPIPHDHHVFFVTVLFATRLLSMDAWVRGDGGAIARCVCSVAKLPPHSSLLSFCVTIDSGVETVQCAG